MIITKTPFRMSFFGGGTDYRCFFEEYGGSVLSTTFDKFSYVNVRYLPNFFEYKNQITYAKIESTKTVDEIVHPAVREAMKMMKLNGLRVAYDADLPARSGLGSSSSFAVGMLLAFHGLLGEYVDKKQLADEAITLERELCKEKGGLQDQIAVAFGGMNRINFTKYGYTVTPILISPERKQQLNNNLMLFFTGFCRFSSDIAKAQIESVKDRTSSLQRMLKMVDEGEKILCSNDDLDDFGILMNEAWELKRGLTSLISNTAIDDIYDNAIEHGALGGKILGAGGGGFLLLYVPPSKQTEIRRVLSDLVYVPFNFENTGATVLYYKG